MDPSLCHKNRETQSSVSTLTVPQSGDSEEGEGWEEEKIGVAGDGLHWLPTAEVHGRDDGQEKMRKEDDGCADDKKTICMILTIKL